MRKDRKKLSCHYGKECKLSRDVLSLVNIKNLQKAINQEDHEAPRGTLYRTIDQNGYSMNNLEKKKNQELINRTRSFFRSYIKFLRVLQLENKSYWNSKKIILD